MVDVGCFFKAFPETGLVQKGNEAKGGKKSKQRFTIGFFVSAAGKKMDEPIVIWKSKVPQCFKGLKGISRPVDAVLSRFNIKLIFQDRKILLFLDNATGHPEPMERKFSHIRITFLAKKYHVQTFNH